MTGMKEGAGEDPFSDDTSTGVESAERTGTDDAQTVSSTSQEATERQQPSRQRMQIPYKFRRDGVQDGRNRVPLFLQEDTKSAERDALRELEERFDGTVSLTDLREALMKVGLQHLDEVQVNLEEWGYGMSFDE